MTRFVVPQTGLNMEDDMVQIALVDDIRPVSDLKSALFPSRGSCLCWALMTRFLRGSSNKLPKTAAESAATHHYKVFYAIDGERDRIIIARVWDTRQDPARLSLPRV
jgi:hypothetical protein